MKTILPILLTAVVCGCRTYQPLPAPKAPAPPVPAVQTNANRTPLAKSLADPVPNFGSITLAWDYPPEELTSTIQFNVYASTNLAFPLSNWTVVSNTMQQIVTLPVTPGLRVFTVTAYDSESNLESPPSNDAYRLPISPLRLKISQ